ncbi:hypothetical protein WKI71_32490 [Streptomyces sp. MS1.AVA.1]|uniref:Uncharacterized protein n=1 Tax=Streptomyces machairae TaxID=3134109 RepID=A0ABU8US47_9ACTN
MRDRVGQGLLIGGIGLRQATRVVVQVGSDVVQAVLLRVLVLGVAGVGLGEPGGWGVAESACDGESEAGGVVTTVWIGTAVTS